MAKPLTGKIVRGELIEPPWEGKPSEAMRVVGGLMTFIGRFGLDLNISDHFYPENQCPLIEGTSADVWWRRYVGSTEGVRNEIDYNYDSVVQGTVVRRDIC